MKSIVADMEEVCSVLLNDGWHRVYERSFNAPQRLRYHRVHGESVENCGFEFIERVDDCYFWCIGPTASILAVRTNV